MVCFQLTEGECRGNRRDQIFLNDVDRQDFVKTQRQAPVGAEAGMRTKIPFPAPDNDNLLPNSPPCDGFVSTHVTGSTSIKPNIDAGCYDVTGPGG